MYSSKVFYSFIQGLYYCTTNSDPCTINTNLGWINKNIGWINFLHVVRPYWIWIIFQYRSSAAQTQLQLWSPPLRGAGPAPHLPPLPTLLPAAEADSRPGRLLAKCRPFPLKVSRKKVIWINNFVLNKKVLLFL